MRLLILLFLTAGLAWGQQFPGAIATDADLGFQVNSYRDTLASGINNSVTSFTVSTGTGAANNMYVKIDSEFIFCTTWTAGSKTFSGCTRGVEGSSAATHASGAAVTGVIVASHHNKVVDEVIAIETQLGVNLANVETETHATEHQHGGNDEVATATPGANAIPKAEADGDLANGWIGLDQAYTWTGDHDFSGGGIAIESGITPPACTGSQLFLDTDATTGQRLMACESGTFVLQGDGGAGGGDNITVNGAAATNADFDDATPAAGTDEVNVTWSKDASAPDNISAQVAFNSPLSATGGALDMVLAVDSVSSTQIRLGANCSATNPCNARIGNDTATLQNSCTCTITGGTESGTWGWEVSAANGNFVCWHNITDANVTVAGTGCVENAGQSAFNADNVPLASDSITTGAFTFSALSDKRGPIGRDVAVAGAAISVTAGADGRRTIALDTTASPTITGDWNFGGGGIEIENGTTPPACTEGQLFFDTDATSGQRLLGCEGTTFVAQGGGGAVYDLVDATNNGYFNPHWQVVDAANANVVNTVGGANNVYLISFSVPGGNRVVTTDVTFQIQVADAAATMEIGIYNAACSSILAQTGALTTEPDTTGFKNVAWSGGAKTLNAGRYWLAVTNDSATLAWRSWQTNDFLNGLLNQTGATRMSTGAATTGGVLNATCGTQTADGNVDPIALVLE